MEREWHPIYSNGGEVECDTRTEKGIDIARWCVNGSNISAAPAQSVTHVSFSWYVSGCQVMEVRMQHNLSPGPREVCISRSEGMTFHQSHQSRPEHLGVSDVN